MPTQAQINANRLNAQKSTGPTSPEGKAASSSLMPSNPALTPGHTSSPAKTPPTQVRRFPNRHHPRRFNHLRTNWLRSAKCPAYDPDAAANSTRALQKIGFLGASALKSLPLRL